MEKQVNLKEMLKEKAQEVQSIVFEIGSLEEAFHYAIDITCKQGGTVLAAPGLGNQDASAFFAFQALCEEKGMSLLKEDLRAQVGRLHTGFTVADYGIAETATIVQDSSSEDLRIATMLSEIHVAVLPASCIVFDAVSLENEMKRFMDSPPNYLAFLSGASRTADIERVLTIGVHGPQEFHILILTEDRA